MLLVPATKIRAVIRMINDRDVGWIVALPFEFANQTRNPLAFVHRAHNFVLAEMMGKFAGIRKHPTLNVQRSTSNLTSRRIESAGNASTPDSENIQRLS